MCIKVDPPGPGRVAPGYGATGTIVATVTGGRSKQLPDPIVCRCEGVPLSAIAAAMRGGAVTPRQIKQATRAGMGACQGRTCRLLVEDVAGATPVQGSMAYRLPSRPVPLGVLAGEEEA